MKIFERVNLHKVPQNLWVVYIDPHDENPSTILMVEEVPEGEAAPSGKIYGVYDSPLTPEELSSAQKWVEDVYLKEGE